VNQVATNTRDQSLALTPLAILAVGVIFVNSFIGVYLVPFQIGVWMDGLQFSASRSGMLGTLEVATMSITSIVAAPRIVGFSLSKVAIAGLVVAVIAQVLTGVSNDVSILVILRVLAGIGCGFIFAAVVSAVAQSKDPDRLMGYGQAVMNLLFMGVFLIIPYALNLHLLRGLFFGLALLMLISLPAFWVLPGTTAMRDDVLDRKNDLDGARVAIHFAAIMLLNVGLGALWGFLERAGIQIGLSASIVASVLSASTLAMIAGSLFAGWLGTRIGRALPMLVAAILCGIAALAAMTAQSLVVYASAVMLYGAAYLFLGPYIIVGMSSALDPSGRLAPASGGVMWLSYSIGIGGGGLIADTISLGAIGWLAFFGCIVSGVLFLLNARHVEGKSTV
jgi:predicted MFS family arabinose efflux permease